MRAFCTAGFAQGPVFTVYFQFSTNTKKRKKKKEKEKKKKKGLLSNIRCYNLGLTFSSSMPNSFVGFGSAICQTSLAVLQLKDSKLF